MLLVLASSSNIKKTFSKNKIHKIFIHLYELILIHIIKIKYFKTKIFTNNVMLMLILIKIKYKTPKGVGTLSLRTLFL
jgi:hypothetical protein